MFSWLLLPQDLKFLVNGTSFHKCILILGRAAALKNILLENPWLETALKQRECSKGRVMITLYGGTRQGRQDSFRTFLKDYCSEHATFFKQSYQARLLFYFIEEQYIIFKNKFLPDTDKLVQIGKKLSRKNRPIKIEHQNFTCELAPTKFIYDGKIRLNTYKIGVDRKPYQLTIRKPNFSDFDTLNNVRIKIDIRKQARLFPPDFIHSMDSTIAHKLLHTTFLTNKYLEDNGILYDYSLMLIHDCFSSGRLLYSILSLRLLDSIRQLFNYNYLNSLRPNFDSEEEFQEFLNYYSVCNPFKVSDISNPNLFKRG